MRDQLVLSPPDEAAYWRKLLQNHTQVTVFLAAALLALIARMTSFSLAYARDDYGFFSDDHALTIAAHPLMLSQGRFGLVWLIDALHWLGLNFSGDYVLGSLVLTLSLVSLAFMSVKLAGLTDRGLCAAAATFIIVLHPYQVEYFTFRSTVLLLSVPIAFAALALRLNRPRMKAILLSGVLLLIGTAIWQQTLVLFGAASLFAASCRFACSRDSRSIGDSVRAAIRESNLAANLIATLAALVSYFFLLWVSVHTTAVTLESRAQLVPMSDMLLRARQVWSLIVQVLFGSEPIFPSGPKALVLGLFLLSGVVALFRTLKEQKPHSWHQIPISILVLPAAILGLSMGAVVPSKVWWPVPRVLIATSWLWAFLAVCSLVWLDRYAERRALRAGTIVLGVVTVAMICLNNQVLTDQVRLNIRDREEMNRIVGRLEATPGFDTTTSLMIVGGSWGYASPISTVQGDLNSSALFPDWSKLPLAREISGYQFQPVDEPGQVATLRSLCAAGEKWPSSKSMHIMGKTAVVCLPEVH